MDQFPSSQDQMIRDLQSEVARLSTEVKQVKGLLILRASGPFFIPNASSPAAQSGGVVAYAIGGEPAWRTSSGSVVQIPEPVSASDPGAPPNYSATSAPGTYQAAYVEAIADAVDAIADYLVDVRASILSINS